LGCCFVAGIENIPNCLQSVVFGMLLVRGKGFFGMLLCCWDQKHPKLLVKRGVWGKGFFGMVLCCWDQEHPKLLGKRGVWDAAS